MDPARWERIQALFHAVVDLPPNEQLAALQSASADDPAIVAEVRALLREDSAAGSVIDRGLADTALRLLDRGTAPLPQETFGAYRLTTLLGEGGMGVVYRAVRDDLGSVAAIKVLRDATLSPARRERFALEQRTLASLNHPAIATLYDADALPNGTPWFAMELVDGVPLVDHCARENLSLGARLRLFRTVCEAVQHAHRHLVIHRDLKPSNILVRADGGVKLLDFGIAKQLESLDQSEATRTGLRLMTPAYAAPEQFRGEQVGIHTDIYALGVILYELLTGRLPFDLADRTPATAETIVTTQEPEKPSAASDATRRDALASRSEWADLDVLCLTAMHKDPQRRYTTVDALIRDIDHFLAREPLEARPDSIGYRIDRFVRRNRRGVLSAAAVLVLILGLSAFYTIGVTRARDRAVAEATRTQRIQRFLVDLFEGGDDAVGPADSLRVVTLIDRGVQEARSLTAEPAVQAELFETLGGVSQQLGQIDRADTLLRQALSQRQRLLGNEHADVAHTLVALGRLRMAQAQYDTAERLIRDGLAMSKRQLGTEHPQVALANDALGHVLELRGNYNDALVAFTESVRLRTNGADAVTPELAAAITGLSNNQFYLGNYAAADSLSRRALEMSRQLYGNQHPHVSEDLINIGAVQYEQGHYAEAEKLYREALAITRNWYGPIHHRTASNLTMLGRAVRALNRNREADSLLRESLGIQERVFGPSHPSVASALNDIALIALVESRYAEAAPMYERVVDIYKKAYNGKHYYIGIGIANLASVHLAQGENARAERGFRESIAMYAQTLPADHLNVGIAQIKLGRALLRQGRFAEAVKESSAGYEIVSKQTTPSIGWLQNARRDLVAAYDSLGSPDKGARYRAELADSAKLNSK
jgi:serine/threonine-protein kinase